MQRLKLSTQLHGRVGVISDLHSTMQRLKQLSFQEKIVHNVDLHSTMQRLKPDICAAWAKLSCIYIPLCKD